MEGLHNSGACLLWCKNVNLLKIRKINASMGLINLGASGKASFYDDKILFYRLGDLQWCSFVDKTESRPECFCLRGWPIKNIQLDLPHSPKGRNH